MIVVTHELSFARQVADNVMLLKDGAVVETGSPEQIFSNPQRADTQQFLSHFLRRDPAVTARGADAAP